MFFFYDKIFLASYIYSTGQCVYSAREMFQASYMFSKGSVFILREKCSLHRLFIQTAVCLVYERNVPCAEYLFCRKVC